MEQILNYINAKLVPPENNQFMDNINPATGEIYSQVPKSSASDVDHAIQAAREAYPTWSALTPTDRSMYLSKLATLIGENLEELARAESIDNGKPIKLARTIDIPRSQSNLQFFADEILSWGKEKFENLGFGVNTVEYSPLGVVGTISPWNLPLYLFTWKIAPALAVGNTVVAKPSEITPMTAYLLSKLCIKAGLPAGVLNIVHGLGPDVGARLTSHPDVKAISFTGSSATGKLIAKNCVESLKKYSLEMGGKNPTIIFSDCDFEKAVETTLRSSFANQGQICLCGSRIFVERSIYEKFKNALVKKINGLKQGNPLDESTQQGAVVSKDHFEKVLSYIQIAKDEGGVILTGGETLKLPAPNDKGYFISPTLIEKLDPFCKTNQDEIFGPVATIIPFDTEDEVIQWANCTEYGLAASVWTTDQTKAQRVASKLQIGIVWINTWLMRDLRTPFGGMKNSGFGREGGRYILEFFSNIKNICVNTEGI